LNAAARLLVAAAVAAAAAGAAHAADYGRFLPPQKAFQLSATPQPGAVRLHWTIADKYYLYKRQFKIEAVTGAIGKIDYPAGQTKDDPNFGRVVVYHHGVDLTVPVTQRPSGGSVELAVTYQGCAEAGLCYPPITKHLTLDVPPAAAKAGTAGGGAAGADAGRASGATGSNGNEQDRLAALVEHANPVWFVLVFFALGVLLAFTPCVLPMVPILAGVVGGEAGRLSTRRGLFLSVVYVLAMALIYTGAGVAAGFAGTGLQAAFQAPWVIGLFAAVFVILAGSLFGFYPLRLPSALMGRLDRLSGRQRGGTWLGAAFMGALSALIVSPCVAAPLAGALIVVGQAGEPVRGGVALFALSLGMGAPLIVFGTVAGRLLPRAGNWMVTVERLLGVAMLAYAVWLVGRVAPAPVALVLWGLTGILAAVFLGVFERMEAGAGPGARLARAAGLAALVWALALMVGGAAGARDPLQPLAPLAGAGGGGAAQATSPLAYHPVKSPAALDSALNQAASAQRPVMVDFYADWCTSCLEMEHTTFRDPKVRAALARMQVLRVDVTANTADDRALLRRYGLYGPPGYVFYGADGRRVHNDTVVGYMAAPEFLGRLQRVLRTP